MRAVSFAPVAGRARAGSLVALCSLWTVGAPCAVAFADDRRTLAPLVDAELASPRPRETVFVVDVSGSMRGYSQGVARALMAATLARPGLFDSFNLVTFEGGSALLGARSLPVSRQSLEAAWRLLEAPKMDRGSTLREALARAVRLPRRGDAARSIVIVSDGFLRLDPKALALIRRAAGAARFQAVGVGPSIDMEVIFELARAAGTEPLAAGDHEEIEWCAARLKHAQTTTEQFRWGLSQPPSTARQVARIGSALEMTYWHGMQPPLPPHDWIRLWQPPGKQQATPVLPQAASALQERAQK